MTLNDYQKAAERTSGGLSSFDKTRNGCYGMCGEAGECIDILKKHEFQGHPLDGNKLMDELGDVLWYVAQTASGLRVSLEVDKNYTNDIDALVLYVLHTHLGFGKKRLRRFYEAFSREHDRLVEHYQLPDDGAWLSMQKLKDIGVDVEKWNRERGAV